MSRKKSSNEEMAEIEKDTGESRDMFPLVGKKWKRVAKEEEHEEWNHAAKGFEYSEEDTKNDVDA